MHIVSSSSNPVPQTMSLAFEALKDMRVIGGGVLAENMKKSVGFRNIVMHSYADIDFNMVYSIAHGHIDDFKQYIKEINQFMGH